MALYPMRAYKNRAGHEVDFHKQILGVKQIMESDE